MSEQRSVVDERGATINGFSKQKKQKSDVICKLLFRAGCEEKQQMGAGRKKKDRLGRMCRKKPWVSVFFCFLVQVCI